MEPLPIIRIGNQSAVAAATPVQPFWHAVDNGFEAFEWFPDKKADGRGWLPNDLDAAARTEIREAAQAHGIRLSVHAQLQATLPTREGQSALEDDLRLTQDLGAELFNIHLDLAQGWDAYFQMLRPLHRRLAESHIQLAVENTPAITPEHVNQLFARWPSHGRGPLPRAGMCLDLGHANLCPTTPNDYLKYLDQLDPRASIIHLHLHENYGDEDTHLTLFTGPAGRDPAGIRGLLQRLKRRQFSGSIILEQWPDPPVLLNQARHQLLAMLSQAGFEGAPAAKDASSLAAILVAGNQRGTSWREKLDFVRELFADETRQWTDPELVDVAIYLRYLATGEIPCAEDGRHFRPSHHSRASRQIQERLARLATADNRFILRRIYPWLPSGDQAFTCAEPLTRIRDIAHRNDIPAGLKHEIKHTLQNKLHRCAGPEDLATSAALLERISAPGAPYPPDFVQQFQVFHGELKEFFNARSLAERLATRAAAASGPEGDRIRQFIAAKEKVTLGLAEQMHCLRALTDLRRSMLAETGGAPSEAASEALITDIGLENYAFVLLSQMINDLDVTPGPPPHAALLETLALTAANLAAGGLFPAECRVLEAEYCAWMRRSVPAGRDSLLGVKATADRTRRLAAAATDRILALFSSRASRLGSALGVAPHAIQVFGDAEIRAHLVFQLAKLAAALLRPLRHETGWAPWDILVPGTVTGRLRKAGTFDDPGSGGDAGFILLLEKAEGDEEIPPNVIGIMLAHPVPQLSHLGVRARQAGIVFVASDDPAPFQEVAALDGQWMRLEARSDEVALIPADEPASRARGTVAAGGRSRSREGGVATRLRPDCVPSMRVSLSPPKCLLGLDEVTLETGGAKAAGARRLEELAARPNAPFKAAPGLVVPFGIMEQALEAAPALAGQYWELVRDIDTGSAADREIRLERLGSILDRLTVPEEIQKGVMDRFGTATRFMVRSSANAEDLEGLAGAGLYDSLANVQGAGLGAAIRAVWASLWTKRAAFSRQQAGVPPNGTHMAVLVQPLLVPDYSFIMHTVNPRNLAAGEAMVELAVGLGETLAGAATPGNPYRMVCEKIDGEMRMTAFANFSTAWWPDPAGGVIRKLVDYSKVGLTMDTDFRRKVGARLGAIAGLVEEAFQKPQDIEGLWAGQDVYLVQSRPQAGL